MPIVKGLENRQVFAVFFPPGCVLLLDGRQPVCVVGLARRKKSSQTPCRFSSPSTIHLNRKKDRLIRAYMITEQLAMMVGSFAHTTCMMSNAASGSFFI